MTQIGGIYCLSRIGTWRSDCALGIMRRRYVYPHQNLPELFDMNELRGIRVACVAVLMLATLMLTSAEAGRLGKKNKACCEEAVVVEATECCAAEGDCCDAKKRCGLMKRLRASKECCGEEAAACCSEGVEAAAEGVEAEACATCGDAGAECCQGKKRCGLMKRLRASKECCGEEAKACCSEA